LIHFYKRNSVDVNREGSNEKQLADFGAQQIANQHAKRSKEM